MSHKIHKQTKLTVRDGNGMKNMKDSILILSNGLEELERYARYLKQTPYEVLKATATPEVFSILKKQPLQCILVDELLSDTTLLIFLKKITKIDPHHRIPVIVLGESGNEKNAIALLKAGASDYLLKSELHPKQLQKAIKNVIEKNNLLKKIRSQEMEMQYLAMHDYLTDIPNRRQFEILAENALSRAKRYKKCFAIILIDIDHFKNINDTLGHETGDIVLKKLAQRFSFITRKNDFVARLGGDEFAIILDLIKTPDESTEVAKRIIDAMSEPLILSNGDENNISVSIGIATYPSAGATTRELIKNADSALYQAKSSGRNTFRHYSKEFNHLFSEYLTIESAAHTALKRKEFYLVFQPIYNSKDNSLYGFETLLRWKSDRLKNYSPTQLIPIIEESGFIIPLGEWILENAFMEFSKIQKPDINLSINISPKQLNDDGFFESVKKLVEKYNITPKNIIFELTETAIITDTKNTIYVLRKLVSLGFRIFVDDFGTGYSSLSFIRQLPISGLKIDKAFVNGIEKNSDDFNMVKSIFVLANNMNLAVIAEGVENENQLTILKKLYSTKVQGYFFGEPLTSLEKIIT